MSTDPKHQRRRSSRRQFLLGKSAIDAVEDLADHVWQAGEPSANSPDQPSSSYLVNVSRKAMACEFAIHLNAGEHSAAVDRALEALDLVETLESQMTVYRDDSEISRINQLAADQPVPVEARLLDLLEFAQSLYYDTDGAFDITAGPLSKAWGFYRRQGRVPEKEALATALDQIGGDKIQIDAAKGTIHYRQRGLEINLGGIGKGYALDRCAELLTAAGVSDFVIHGGQSSVLAKGARAGKSHGAWQVDLRHPLRPRDVLASVFLRDCALGTSGTAQQSFYHRGRRYGHIIDPRTGWPAEGMHSATVVAPDAATADALATACYVLGPEKARAYLERNRDVGALFVCRGQSAGTVAAHIVGLDEETVHLHGMERA